jgi:hypothetical protein
MKNFITYLLLLILFLGCSEKDSSVSKKAVSTPPKNNSIINWAFFNADGLQNISFPIWFNDSLIMNRGIKQIHFSINEFEHSEDSTFQDTIPSTSYEAGYTKEGLNIFYVQRYSEEIKIEVRLNLGSGQDKVWTCDLSYEYVEINAEYHT